MCSLTGVTRSHCQGLRCDEYPIDCIALSLTFLAAEVVRDFGWNSVAENCHGEPSQRNCILSCCVILLRRLVLPFRHV